MKNTKSIKRLNDLFPPHFDCGKIINLCPLRFKHFHYAKGDSFRNLRTKSEFYITSDEINNYQYEVLKGKDDLQVGDWTEYIYKTTFTGIETKQNRIFFDLLKQKDYHYSADIIYDLSLYIREFTIVDDFECYVNWILEICNETDISK